MSKLRLYAQVFLHFLCGVRIEPPKPKPIYRWTTFENGRSIWLTEGYQYADGSKYRLPALGHVTWADRK